MVVKAFDPTKLSYELTNIQLEHEVMCSVSLTQKAESTYINGKQFVYHVNHKTVSLDNGTNSNINESINIPRRSMKGILLLLSKPHNAGVRDLEKFFNPGITSMKGSVNGVPDKVYSQGVEGLDMWNEVL